MTGASAGDGMPTTPPDGGAAQHDQADGGTAQPDASPATSDAEAVERRADDFGGGFGGGRPGAAGEGIAVGSAGRIVAARGRCCRGCALGVGCGRRTRGGDRSGGGGRQEAAPPEPATAEVRGRLERAQGELRGRGVLLEDLPSRLRAESCAGG